MLLCSVLRAIPFALVLPLPSRKYNLAMASHPSAVVTARMLGRVRQQVLASILPNNPTAKILNIYLWGSRIHGNSSRSSDWDFTVIVENYDEPEIRQALQVPEDPDEPHTEFSSNSSIEISIHDKVFFQELVDSHVPWALALLFHPKEYIYQEDHKFALDLRLPKLRRALTINTSVNSQQIRSNFLEGLVTKAKKRLFHVIQMIVWSMQLIRFDRITDTTAANVYFKEIMDTDFQSQAHFEGYWKPLLAKLEAEHTALFTAYTPFEQQFVPTTIAPIVSIAYIEKFGLHALTRNMSISVTPGTSPVEGEEIYHLRYSREYSPQESRVVQECNSLIVARATSCSPWRVICFPFHRFFGHTHHEAPTMNWSSRSLQLHEWIDGNLVYLYSYHGAWMLASSYSFDGSQLIPKTTRKVADEFWRVWNESNYQMPQNESYCYCFELVLQQHRQTWPYQHDRIVFTGARNMKTLQELDILQEKDCKNVEWEAPQRIDTRSLPANEVATPRLNDVEALARKTIMGSAGWIVCEEIPGSISFRRIVVRNPIMVELMSFRFSGEHQQENILLNMFKHFGGLNHPILETCPFDYSNNEVVFDRVKTAFMGLCAEVDRIRKSIEDEKPKDLKEFAALATKNHGVLSHFVLWTKTKGYRTCIEFISANGPYGGREPSRFAPT